MEQFLRNRDVESSNDSSLDNHEPLNLNDELGALRKQISSNQASAEQTLDLQNSIRPIERLGAGQWLVPYNDDEQDLAYDFVVTVSYKGISIKAREHVPGLQDAYYHTELEEVTADEPLPASLGEFTMWLGPILNDYFDDIYKGRVDSSGNQAKRLSMYNKAELLYQKIQAFEQVRKKDGFAVLTVKPGTTLLQTLRKLNEDKQLDLDERGISDLAAYCMIDNDIEDERDIPKGTRVLILQSTLDPLLPDASLKRHIAVTVQLDKTKVETEGAYSHIVEAFERYYPQDKLNTQKLRVFLNGVLNFNNSLRPGRSVKATTYVNIPTKKYIDTYNAETTSVMKSVRAGAKHESSEKEIVSHTTLDHLTTMLKQGRDGFMYAGDAEQKVRTEAKNKEKDYRYMKIKTMNLPAPTSGNKTRFQYILDAFLDYEDMPKELAMIAPGIFLQETGCRNLQRENGSQAKGIAQFTRKGGADARYWSSRYGKPMPLYVPGKIDKRGDMVISINATARGLVEKYNEVFRDSRFRQLVDTHNFNTQEAKLLCSLLVINAHNSGPWHTNRILQLATDISLGEVNLVDRRINESGFMGLIYYMTEDYASRWGELQKGTKRKYAVESPNYIYQVVKFATMYMQDPEYADIVGAFAGINK